MERLYRHAMQSIATSEKMNPAVPTRTQPLGWMADPGKEETPDPGTATKDGRRAPGVHWRNLRELQPIGKDEPDFF